MLSLPIYLRVSTYYLHTRVHGRQIKKSLQTSDKRLAVFRACRLLEALGGGSVDLSNIRKYELDLARGVAKSDGPEDHQRMMEALKILQSPVAGAQTAIPLGSSPSSSKSGLRLKDLLDKLFLLKSAYQQATVLAYKNTVQEFSTFLANPYIQNIGISDVTRYQEFLAKKKNTTRTIDNKVAVLRAIFNFAIKQGYYFDANPAQNRSLMTKAQKEKGGYDIFDGEQISQIFDSEFFKKSKTDDPDYYWALILGVFTGCRISEITGLTSDQFRTTPDGTRFIDVTDSKTSAGIRQVPIPKYIFSSGLDDFIEGKKQIFKYKLRLGKGSGNAVGKKFARHLELVQMKKGKFVFHSLRKFVNNFMLDNDISLEVRSQFVGHETNSINIKIYTKTIQVEKLASMVSQIQMKIAALTGLVKTKF